LACLAAGNLTLDLTPAAWVYSVAVSLMVAAGAFTLLNLAGFVMIMAGVFMVSYLSAKDMRTDRPD